ncbi:hypothetical protein SAMN04489727_5326 [Amycolatopsis tolypomycina]|uniref:Thioesterase-like superfamily protein n=1 Tax=Amycolatopsis tolypomycina TaxID=208445 RepID=A0A1H4VVE4_9PSEU|nr:hypothetical protein [Amycolatopsis tolypomycina]SEC84945.1 hypothetical protein SAMN04489727_5326 [Amycolatopsis tolypomycina]
MRIDRRFTGPANSAHGGYACALFAHRAADLLGVEPNDVAVTLHAPPPLDSPLCAEPAARRVHVWHRDELIATVRESNVAIGTADFVELPVAEQSAAHFAGRIAHPFPTCFACGTARLDDGVGLSPGPVRGRPGTVACPWTTPAAPVPDWLVWAVLDCAGGWLFDQQAEPMVLAHLAVRLAGGVPPGERTIVTGRLDSRSEHGATVTTTLYRPGGGELGRAHATWARHRR